MFDFLNVDKIEEIVKECLEHSDDLQDLLAKVQEANKDGELPTEMLMEIAKKMFNER